MAENWRENTDTDFGYFSTRSRAMRQLATAPDNLPADKCRVDFRARPTILRWRALSLAETRCPSAASDDSMNSICHPHAPYLEARCLGRRIGEVQRSRAACHNRNRGGGRIRSWRALNVKLEAVAVETDQPPLYQAEGFLARIALEDKLVHAGTAAAIGAISRVAAPRIR